MRRKDREIKDRNEIEEIIKKCDVCRIALFDEEYPYILPMNFGYTMNGLEMELFFHCANSGKKLDLIRNNAKAGFEMDCSHNLITGDKACDYTMEFESVCGNGIIELINDDQKEIVLTHLMKQYSTESTFVFDEKLLKVVTVFKLKVHQISGKRLNRS
jgi:nitroimidazol reductase NimA-like FMN-containing flavoprotein (pyridoxamine 5'-phosphate oxidase superfamily)